MFAKNSRYHNLPDVTTTDAGGRTLRSKSLRLLPEVAGVLRHTVAEGDRLDHLAYKYYRQPRRWWRLCDANPDFLSPLALLGGEPLAWVNFRLAAGSVLVGWHKLRRTLAAQPGVEDVQLDCEYRLRLDQPFHENDSRDGEETVCTIQIRFNRMLVESTRLRQLIENTDLEDVDLEIVDETLIQRNGKEIAVPPDTTG